MLYSLVVSILARSLKLIALIIPKLRVQLKDRPQIQEVARDLALERAKFRHCAIFFCSSAGEYEQALPIIARLQAQNDTYVQVLFFSKSGLDYIKARGEKTPCMLVPVTDSIWQWGSLFSALLPTITCVVRHELWPGFLCVARRFGHLYLIDASFSQGERNSRFWGFMRRKLLQNFDHIFAVSQYDFNYFTSSCKLPSASVTVTSDTKYDRVVERARARPEIVKSLRKRFELLAPDGVTHRLVLGSAYLFEVDLLLNALRDTETLIQKWQIIIVPHYLKRANIDAISAKIETEGFRPLRYSTLTDQSAKSKFLIIDKMGMLAEIYGTADAALVGGALHHQVHNVLEPASHGLAIAFGPFYKNSQEAIHLVNVGLAAVVSDGAEFRRWWQGLDSNGQFHRQQMLDATKGLTGAADLIIAKWRQQMDA